MQIMQEMFAESNSLVSSIIKKFPNGSICILDKSLKVLIAEGSELYYQQQFSGNIIGKTIADLYPPDIAVIIQEEIQKSLKGQEHTFDIKLSGQFYQYIVVPILDKYDKVNQFLVVTQNVTSKKMAERKLLKQNEKLLKSNQELNKLIYNVTHDLRAPLNSAIGLIDIIKNEQEQSNKEYYLSLVEKSLGKLDAFIKDIVDVSKNNGTEVNAEKIDFVLFIQEIVETQKYSKEGQKVDINIRVSQKNSFFSDFKRLEVILGNLISNAIRYHNPYIEHPMIEITVQSNENYAKIKVKDNGLGIEQIHLDKIFDMFYRASNRETGSGLGLYIVKEATIRLKGKIEVSSKQGKGTVFTLEIPNVKPFKRS